MEFMAEIAKAEKKGNPKETRKYRDNYLWLNVINLHFFSELIKGTQNFLRNDFSNRESWTKSISFYRL